MGDPYFSNVALLMHMDGGNNSTTFSSNANNGKVLTASGSTKISTAQSKFGGASVVLNGTSDALLTPASTDLSFYNTPFTVEMWVNFASLSNSNQTIFNLAPTHVGLDLVYNHSACP
jgi:hypothetical protein